MARSNEYRSEGGSFDNLSDALSSIDNLLKDVKQADENREVPHEKQRGFRNVISELQAELGACIAELMKSWDELDLDPLYIYSTEELSVTEYSRHIKFLHPEYEHVWLTEGKGQDVGSSLIPFIDYGIVYNYEQKKLTVTNLLLDTKLNLPDFKTSLQAAHVDLEILKEDAKRVEVVCANGEAAYKRLSETLRRYCDAHDLELVIEEESIPYVESPEERAARLRMEAEAKRKEEQEARKQAEEEERAARRKEEEEERIRMRAEAKAARAAKTKDQRPISRSPSGSAGAGRSLPPPMPSAVSNVKVSAPPIPPRLKKS